MPQDRESGAKANEFGHQNATTIIAQLGGTNRKPGSNEFDLKGERVSVHSAHYRNGRLQSVGVTLNCLKTIRTVLGAFQNKDGSYQLLNLPAEQFKKFSRPTASRGASADRVVARKTEDLRGLWEIRDGASCTGRLEMLRTFFRFCVDSDWMDKNPATAVKLPVVDFEPTLPYTAEQMEKILWAVDSLREIHPQMPEGKERMMRAFILVMRCSGIRISDAVILTREKIKDSKIFLHKQSKTSHPVNNFLLALGKRITTNHLYSRKCIFQTLEQAAFSCKNFIWS